MKHSLDSGTQIVYVPLHAQGNANHPDAEEGFIFAIHASNPNLVHCRFWNKRSPSELRTKANSELCNTERLHFVDTRPQEDVDAMIKWIINQE